MRNQEEIHNQCISKDPDKRVKGLIQFEPNFSSLTDKQQAWNDLIQLTLELGFGGVIYYKNKSY